MTNIPVFLAGSGRSTPWGPEEIDVGCWVVKGGSAVRVNVASVLSIFMSVL